MNNSQECAKEISQGYYNVPLTRIEKLFSPVSGQGWMMRNWHLTLVVSVVYLISIYFGQKYMKNRPAFKLRRELFLWNLFLAVFSIFASFRLVTELFFMIRDYGFVSPLCDYGTKEHRQTIIFWIYLFCVSKLLELGDTAFIVLRKQKLIFLHWYHHISVMIYVWYTCAYIAAMCYPFMTLNFIVHSVMYSYFALKSLQIKIPRAVSMMITILQLMQMVVGIYITAFVYMSQARGVRSCCAPREAVAAALIMYGSYFILFMKFFVDVYWRKTNLDQYTTKKVN